MDRPTLKVSLGMNPFSKENSIVLNDKSLLVKSIEIVADATGDRLNTVLLGFHPEFLEVDLDARCIRLNGAQLPEETGRAFLAQLKELYGE